MSTNKICDAKSRLKIHHLEMLDKLDRYSGKWRNLYFTFGGKAYRDIDKNVRDTEEEVIKLSKEAFVNKLNTDRFDHFIFSCGTKKGPHEVSHAVPMPEGE